MFLYKRKIEDFKNIEFIEKDKKFAKKDYKLIDKDKTFIDRTFSLISSLAIKNIEEV